MNRVHKFIGLTLAASVFTSALPAVAYADSTQNRVTVYAGPQSVRPDESIFVTVEVTGKNERSLVNERVALSFLSDDDFITLTGKTERGLVSFEIPAQATAGLMSFSAKVKGTPAKDAQVLVTAHTPQTFTLTATPAKQPGHISIRSSRIADVYGNQISDMSLVTVDWIDQRGLSAKQTVLPSRGRINLTAACPRAFTGALQIRASLHTLQITTSDISSLCREGERKS